MKETTIAPYWIERQVSDAVARDCNGDRDEFASRAAAARAQHDDGMDGLRDLFAMLAEQVITGCRFRHQYMSQQAIAEFARLASEAWHVATGHPLPEPDDETHCFFGVDEPTGDQMARLAEYRAWKRADRADRDLRWREYLAR